MNKILLLAVALTLAGCFPDKPKDAFADEVRPASVKWANDQCASHGGLEAAKAEHSNETGQWVLSICKDHSQRQEFVKSK